MYFLIRNNLRQTIQVITIALSCQYNNPYSRFHDYRLKINFGSIRTEEWNKRENNMVLKKYISKTEQVITDLGCNFKSFAQAQAMPNMPFESQLCTLSKYD